VIGSRIVASESLATRPPNVRRPDLPLVTVVTPSYNQGRFIRDTIESVLAQDYPNVEYIVVDGLSKDETAAVCAEYVDRLTFISEKDTGQSDAINKGFRLARGEIVAWLNSDDIFLPGAIGHVVEAFMNEPELGAVYGEGYQSTSTGRSSSAFRSPNRSICGSSSIFPIISCSRRCSSGAKRSTRSVCSTRNSTMAWIGKF
jgi:glycosyltransferase involved in cell wall biosynthesis